MAGAPALAAPAGMLVLASLSPIVFVPIPLRAIGRSLSAVKWMAMPELEVSRMLSSGAQVPTNCRLAHGAQATAVDLGELGQRRALDQALAG